MNTLKAFANRMTHVRRSFLRVAEEIVSNPVLANHTPAGPGSLATGQAAAKRSGVHLQRGACGPREPAARDYPTPLEYSLPLRQVFWI